MTSRHTILYAEDDLDDVFMVTKAFEAHDHIEVLHAPNGEEALKILNHLHLDKTYPCLVILDINMPILNGKETLVRIKSKEEYSRVPVVLFSTSSSKIDKDFAHHWGVELYTKPLHFNDLESIARQFADKCNFEINKVGSFNSNGK